MKYILKKLEKKTTDKQHLYSLSYKDKFGKITSVIGKLKGTISTKILGKKGFGYDPIFIPNNNSITFGQMNKSKKIKMDHRYIAFKKLKKRIKTL